MPKPLIWTHQFASTNVEHMQLEPPPGYESQDRMVQKNRVFITFPPFHGAFLASHLFNAIPHGTIMIAPTSGAIATGQGLVDALKHTDIDAAFLVPSIALDLAKDATLLDTVSKRIQRILYCGGDLPQAIGDVIASKIPLYNQYGASEMGLTPQIWGHRSMADWKYIEPHPEIGAEFRHSSADLYEYHIARKPDGFEQPAAFSIFPDLDAYPSRDLYVRHPTNTNLWRWKARVDDVIVFLNGEKTNPNTMEQHITTSNPDVARALVAGAQRFQASLLVQPVDGIGSMSVAERAAFIERIWPSVQEANQECPAHARIAKSHILFTTPTKPMMIAGKGTVQRAGTYALYEEELEKLYTDADTADTAALEDFAVLSGPHDITSVTEFVRKTVLQVTDLQEIGLHDDFYARGIDSLQALLLLRRLKHGLALPALALSTIYTNPSVSSLSQAAFDLSQDSSATQAKLLGEETRKLEAMLARHKAAIDNIPAPSTGSVRSTGTSVLLTGSTGSLGCHLLQTLLSNPNVTAIHCLNRASDGGRALQASRLAERGLEVDIASDQRIVFHHADLSDEHLGLSSSTYSTLQHDVSHVIHAAWPVDFNLPIESFEPHLDGLVNLLKLASSAAHKNRFMFISSISSVMSLQTNNGETPELVIDDLKAPARIGYGQSKLLGELLVAHASSRFPTSALELAFARVGQVAGAIGASNAKDKIVTWKAAEWFPSLVVSSAYTGTLPNSLGSMGRIDWVPMDVLAAILAELTLYSGSPHHSAGVPEVYHPHNLHPIAWPSLQASVIAAVERITGKRIQVVSPDIWLENVQKAIEIESIKVGGSKAKAVSDEDLAKLLKLNPGVKLLDFYREALTSEAKSNVFVTEKASQASETLRGLKEVQGGWVERWTDQWLHDAGY